VELTDLLAVLRRFWALALICFVFVFALGVLAAILPATSYSTSVKVLVVPKNAADAGNDVQVLQFVVSALPAVVESPNFARHVAQALPLADRAKPVILTGSSDQTTGQLTIAVKSTEKALVVPWANAAAKVVTGGGAGPVTANADLVVLNLAPAPSSSASERPFVVLGGGLLAVIIGILVPLQVDRTRRRSNRVDYLQRRLDLPVIGTIPTFSPTSGWPLPFSYERGTEGEEVRAVFEAVRLSLLLALQRRPIPALTLLAAGAGEGTSVLTAGLAWSLVVSGTPVLGVDYNSANPSLKRLLAKPSPANFGSQSGRSPGGVGDTGWPDLKLALGASGLRRAENRRLQFMEASEPKAGLILVDGSALERSAEGRAAALATQSVVVVADARHRTVKDIGRTVLELRLLGVEVIGIILNHASPEGRRTPKRLARSVGKGLGRHHAKPAPTNLRDARART
jgi:capsular polysaccharide biosynthesis protein/Mrp family chromosome partitioning ATPase